MTAAGMSPKSKAGPLFKQGSECSFIALADRSSPGFYRGGKDAPDAIMLQ
jgi:hypothetical protein